MQHTKPPTGPHLSSVLDELNTWLIVRRCPSLAASVLADLSTGELEVAWAEIAATPVRFDDAKTVHARLVKDLQRLVREIGDGGPNILFHRETIDAFEELVALAKGAALVALLSLRDVEAEREAASEAENRSNKPPMSNEACAGSSKAVV